MTAPNLLKRHILQSIKNAALAIETREQTYSCSAVSLAANRGELDWWNIRKLYVQALASIHLQDGALFLSISDVEDGETDGGRGLRLLMLAFFYELVRCGEVVV